PGLLADGSGQRWPGLHAGPRGAVDTDPQAAVRGAADLFQLSPGGRHPPPDLGHRTLPGARAIQAQRRHHQCHQRAADGRLPLLCVLCRSACPMSLRSPLGRVLGLGSAKEGVQHWWVQRLTSVALVPLGVWFTVSLLSLPSFEHTTVIAWMAQSWTSLLLI